MIKVLLPERITRGDVVEVRLVIQHPMETGFRIEDGQRVPRNAIHSLVCRYDRAEVFRATLSPGIAANPYLRFFTRAMESGELEVWWLDDNDVQDTVRVPFTVR